jgi:Ricin-type beta-trefoil lectin domain
MTSLYSLIILCIITVLIVLYVNINDNPFTIKKLSDKEILDIIEGGFVDGGLKEEEGKNEEIVKKAIDDVFKESTTGNSSNNGNGEKRKRFYEGDINWKFTDTNDNYDCWTKWDYASRGPNGDPKEDKIIKENITKTMVRKDGRPWCAVDRVTSEKERREIDKPKEVMDYVNQYTGNVWGLVGAVGLGLTEELIMSSLKKKAAKTAQLAAKKTSQETSEKAIKEVGQELQEDLGKKLFKENNEKIAKEGLEKSQKELAEKTFKSKQKKLFTEVSEEISSKLAKINKTLSTDGLKKLQKEILENYGTKSISSMKDDFLKKSFATIKSSVDGVAMGKLKNLAKNKIYYVMMDVNKKTSITSIGKQINKKLLNKLLNESRESIAQLVYKKVINAFKSLSDNIAKLATKLIWKSYSIKLKIMLGLSTFFRSQAKTFLSIGKALMRSGDDMAKMTIKLTRLGSTMAKSAIKNGFKTTMKAVSKLWLKMKPGPMAMFDILSFALDMADVGGYNAYMSTKDFEKAVEKSNVDARNAFRENIIKQAWYKDSGINVNNIDYPLILDPTIDISTEELQASISEKYELLFKLADIGERHIALKAYFDKMETDISNGILKIEHFEDAEIMKTYNDLVDIDSIEGVVRKDNCSKVGGLLYGDDNMCTYTENACNNLYKWPLSDAREDDIYAEFRNGICVQGNQDVRNICDGLKATWNVKENKCNLDKKWCLSMGAEFNSSTNVCTIPLSQEVIEFIFGTSVTRLAKEIGNVGIRPAIELMNVILDPPTVSEYVGTIKNEQENKCFSINTSSFPFKIDLQPCDGNNNDQKFYYNPDTGLLVANAIKYRDRYLCAERPYSEGESIYMNYCDSAVAKDQQWDLDVTVNNLNHRSTKGNVHATTNGVKIKTSSTNPNFYERKLVFGKVEKKDQAEFNKRIATGFMNATTFGMVDWSPIIMSGSVIMDMMKTVENIAKGFLDIFADKCDVYSYNNDTIKQSTQATTTGSTTNITTTTPTPAPAIIPIFTPPPDKLYCGEFKIRDKCLDVNSGNSGVKAQIWDCNGTKAQKFVYDSKDNTIRLVSDKGRCLDIAAGNINDGTVLQMWDCNGSDAQKFIYDPNTKRIQSKVKTDKCIDLMRDVSDNGNNFQVLGCKDHRAQQFSAGECTPNALESMGSSLAEGAKDVGTVVGNSFIDVIKFW